MLPDNLESEWYVRNGGIYGMVFVAWDELGFYVVTYRSGCIQKLYEYRYPKTIEGFNKKKKKVAWDERNGRNGIRRAGNA